MNMDNMQNMDHQSTSSMDTSNATGASMAMGMMGTFSTSTRVTLFFSDWTTDTPAKYFGTLIFLFVVTLLNRFLGAWRSQLGHKWANDAAEARRKVEQRREYRRNRDRARSNHLSLDHSVEVGFGDSDSEKAPLSPSTQGPDVEAGVKKGSDTPTWMLIFGGRWRAGNPWRVNIDLPRAVLEGVRALIGYLL